MLSLFRQTLWIVRARRLVKLVLGQCVTWDKKLRGKFGAQRIAELPAERVTPSKPAFPSILLNCFGPFYVERAESESRGMAAFSFALLCDLFTQGSLTPFHTDCICKCADKILCQERGSGK